MLYGRRKGRSFSEPQQALLDDGVGQFAITQDFSLQDLRPRGAKTFKVEIGFGGGEHLAYAAALAPDTAFLGFEPFLNGVCKLYGLLQTEGLTNVQVYPGDAKDILATLPDQCLDGAYLLFPDPWPKARHHKRRFFSKENVALLARLLKPGSQWLVATDHPAYYDWMVEVVRGQRFFTWVNEATVLQEPPQWIPTRYQQKAVAAGRVSRFICLRRNVGENVV